MLPRDKRVEKIDLAYVSLCGDVIAMRDGIALLLCCACSVGGCTGDRQPATHFKCTELVLEACRHCQRWNWILDCSIAVLKIFFLFFCCFLASFVTLSLPNSVYKGGGCQPVAWTVMFPRWLPVGLMWRFLPARRLRYAPAILLLLLRKAFGSNRHLYVAVDNKGADEILLRW